MNKILVAAIMVLVTSVSIQASQIAWGNDPEIYKASGAIVGDDINVADTDYFIRLYKSVDDTIDFSIVGGVINLGANDTYTGIQFNWNSAGAAGLCYQDILNTDTTYGLNAGDKFYSVIFDTSLVAGNCAIIDDSIATVSYPAGIMTYNAGAVVGGMQGAGGDWQAIPEPATGMLLAIGGGIAWLIRTKQRLL